MACCLISATTNPPDYHRLNKLSYNPRTHLPPPLRPPRASPSRITVTPHTRRLFHAAASAVSRRYHLPTNIGAINVEMCAADPRWRVRDETGGSLSALCRLFEREGVVRLQSSARGRHLELW